VDLRDLGAYNAPQVPLIDTRKMRKDSNSENMDDTASYA
jgi:hypothetical protein